MIKWCAKDSWIPSSFLPLFLIRMCAIEYLLCFFSQEIHWWNLWSILNMHCLLLPNILLSWSAYNVIWFLKLYHQNRQECLLKHGVLGSTHSSLSFWFSSSIMEANHLCLQQVSRGCWRCWSQNHTLRTTGILCRAPRMKWIYLHFRPSSAP